LQLYDSIIRDKGCCSINGLASQFKINPRTIHRIFINHIGISPKAYLKIIRFNNACKLMGDYPDIDWFDIIGDCGYYDQMHFIHEFKKIINYNPLQLLKKSEGNFYFERPLLIMNFEE